MNPERTREPAREPASRLHIDLDAVAHNLGVVRAIVGPEVAICPVVKADAYGLGAARIARTLAAAGADLLAVYTPDQARELLREAIPTPLLVLMPMRSIQRTDQLYRSLVCGRLHLTVHDRDQLDELAALADRFGTSVRVHLEVDTGMTRGGCDVAAAGALLATIAAHPRLELSGLFTHFASADVDAASAEKQDAALDALITEQAELVPASCLVHAASTYATIRAARFHRAMVRVGVAWAGYGAELVTGDVDGRARELRPCLRWTSHLMHVRRIKRGTRVGYRARWRAKRNSVIGLVPVGYADGYPFALGDGGNGAARGTVRVRSADAWHDAPVVGAISMDQLTIDLTDVPEPCAGAEVELVGDDPSTATHLPRLAEAAATIPYELLCRLSPRLERTFTIEPRPLEIVTRPTDRPDPRATPRPAQTAGA